MRELTLPEIHRVTLELMDEIHRICEENQIRYFIAYGTLIGAIRHNGFIPWDDDFDIQMTRPDYEKFYQIVRQRKHPYYQLCDRRSTPNYYYGIPRFSDTRYQYISTRKYEEGFDNGIFIDIYPMDNFGNTYEEAKRVKKKVDRLSVLYTWYTNSRNEKGGLMSLAQGLGHRLLRLVYGNKLSDRIDDWVMDTIRKNTSDDDKQVGEVCWDYLVTPYQREWFKERELHAFEDRQYWIPKEYDLLLRTEYGDYMQLPPEEKRHPHHDYVIVER